LSPSPNPDELCVVPAWPRSISLSLYGLVITALILAACCLVPALADKGLARNVESMHPETASLGPNARRSAISCAFGPRIAVAEISSDVHCFINIRANGGDRVVAALLNGIQIYAGGGLAVILHHELDSPELSRGENITAVLLST
jgi:hypothetical protein